MNTKAAFLLTGALMAAGCSGSISTQRLSDKMQPDPQTKVSGIVYYPPALFAEVTLKTALVRDGKLIGRSGESPPACNDVTAEKVVMLPDLKNPHTIQYQPGMFETNTFGVSLKDGMLAAVNSQPTADRSQLPSLIPAGTPLAPIAGPMGMVVGGDPMPRAYAGPMAVAAREDIPACNDGPVIVGYRRLELPPAGTQAAQEAGR